MARPTTTHCQRGHLWTPENTRTSTDRYGYIHRICKQCRNAYVNAKLTLRYRNDPEWREQQKAYSRNYWHTVRKHKPKGPTCEAP